MIDFIDYERSTLIPMKASDPPWGSPPNAYELLKIEIEFFVQNYFDRTGQLPSNDAMQVEACRIVFAADATANVQYFATEMSHQSWLRDLIMSSAELTRQARFGPIRTSSESRHSPLRITGKDHLFEQCTFEAQLQTFVFGQQLSGARLDDSQIQNEACEIVRRMEKESVMPSDIVANWIVKGIYSGTEWLANFKRRAGVLDNVAMATPVNTDSAVMPDAAVQWPQDSLPLFTPTAADTQPGPSETQIPLAPVPDAPATHTPTTIFDMHGRPRAFLPEDTNFFRCFELDIKRWVAATMSSKNPNCHVPSDEEIQHQARWIMYDGDDPWNQTPADYSEWLWRFKRDMGISQSNDGINPAQLTGQPPGT